MKRKTIVVLCMMVMTLAISACGKKNKVEPPVEEVSTEKDITDTKTATEETSAPAMAEEVNEADVAMQKYEAFLAGDEKVCINKYEFKARVEDDDPFDYFSDKNGYLVADFFRQVIETESKGYDSFPFERAEYAFIDCGMDGIPELAMKAYFTSEWDTLEREYVIKMIDDKLELTYMDESYYRDYTSIINVAGVVTETGSSGAASSFYKIGILDKDGRFVLDYTENTNYTALYMLGSRFDNAVENTEEDYSTLFLRRYAFEENIDGSDFDNYEKRALYCAQLKEDDESNGIDRKENEHIAKTLFNYVGEKLYSLDEISSKIAERESNIGFSDDVKNAKEISFADLKLDSNYINGDIFSEEDGVMLEETYMEYIYIGSLDCFKWESEDRLSIVFDKGQTFYLDSNTTIHEGVPCNDDNCDAITWINRYIDHCPITDDSDPDGPYYCLGFGGFDEWQVMIDEDYNIKEIIDIFAAD